MKKVILVFEGTSFSEGAFNFARNLNALKRILLTGVFLPQAQLADLWSYADGISGPFIPTLESNEAILVQKNIERFEGLCTANNIQFAVHRDFFDFALTDLKKESRFADLLILGSEVFYAHSDATRYLHDALNDIACPVLLVPEQSELPESIILAYDGSNNSIFAIKQFAYLLPELNNKRTLLVYANNDTDKDLPDKQLIEELALRHFADLTLYKLNLNPKKYFGDWLLERKSAMLVCGSHGRSGLSKLFKRSFIKDIINNHKIPVFIAHT